MPVVLQPAVTVTATSASAAPVTLSHAQLAANTDAFSRQLRALGVAVGETVSIPIINSAEFIVAFIATTLTGAAANPLNPDYTEAEFTFYLQDTKSRFMLLLKGSCPNARAAAAANNVAVIEVTWCPTTGSVIFASSSLPAPAPAALPAPPADAVALILHTSGTTNRPKAVPLTHANLMASVRNIAGTYALTPADIGLLVMPLFHVHGLMCGLLAPLYVGGSVVVQYHKFSASRFWTDLLAYKCSWFTAVPTMHQILLSGVGKRGPAARAELQSALRAQGRLRFVRSCSSALAPATLRAVHELLGVPVIEAYAMTEASHQMTSNTLTVQKPGSVGVGHGVAVSIRDDSGRALPAESEGEICVQGPNVTAGYLNNPKANAESFFPGGWLRTGDRGRADADGFIYITGRLKEMINRGGEKIMPGEVDAALLEHPLVAEAVVFAAPHALLGQVVHAAVVLKPGAPDATGDSKVAAELKGQIQQFVRGKLAAFKVPVEVYFAKSVPRTATGKIQRRFVAEHFLKPQAKL